MILRLSNPYGGIVSKNKKQGIIDVIINKIRNDETLEFYGNFKKCKRLCTSIDEVLKIIEGLYDKKIKIENKNINTYNIYSNILNVDKINKVISVDNIYSYWLKE